MSGSAFFLEAFKTRIDTLVSRATVLVKNGVPKDQLMAQLKTDDLGWHLSFSGEQFESFYAELSDNPTLRGSSISACQIDPVLPTY